jgi:hypothetical protein
MGSEGLLGTMIAMIELDDLDGWPPERAGRRGDPSICRSVHGAYHALGRRLRISTRDHGLGTSEALVLAYLLRQPGCAAAVIAHALGFHRSTLSSLLDRLEAKASLTDPAARSMAAGWRST